MAIVSHLPVSKGEPRSAAAEGRLGELGRRVKAAHWGHVVEQEESSGLAPPFPCCVTWERPLALSGPQYPHPGTRMLIPFSGSRMLVGKSVLLCGKVREIVAVWGFP